MFVFPIELHKILNKKLRVWLILLGIMYCSSSTECKISYKDWKNKTTNLQIMIKLLPKMPLECCLQTDFTNLIVPDKKMTSCDGWKDKKK